LREEIAGLRTEHRAELAQLRRDAADERAALRADAAAQLRAALTTRDQLDDTGGQASDSATS
jgi:hypothetical protein